MITFGSKYYFDTIINSPLAPNQSITHLVLTQSGDYDYDHISKFEITYKSNQKTYTEQFSFNLAANSRMPSIGISNGNIERQFLELYQDQIRKNL